MVDRRQALVGVAAGVLVLGTVGVVGVVVGNAGGGDSDGADDGRPGEPTALIYLSGLDDHLLAESSTIELHAEPDGEVVAEAPASSLAWVHAERGQWLEVVIAEGQPLRGWVGDYHPRAELHVVDPDTPGCPVPVGDRELDPSTKVRLVDILLHGDDTWVLVRPLDTDTTSWVPRDALSEVPGPDVRAVDPASCAEITYEPPQPPHTH